LFSLVSIIKIHSRVSSKGVWQWCTDHTWRFDCTVCTLTIILEITRRSGNWTISGVRWKSVKTHTRLNPIARAIHYHFL
jgi:hypothetical protein